METLTVMDGPLGKRRVELAELIPGQRPDVIQVECRLPIQVLTHEPGSVRVWLTFRRSTVEGLVGVRGNTYEFEALAMVDPDFPEVTGIGDTLE